MTWWRGRQPRARGARPTFSTLVWFTVGMALATVPFLGRIPWWLVAGIVALMSWRLRQAWRSDPPLTTQVRTMVALGALAVLWFTRTFGYGLEAAAPLLVTFLWLKLIEFERERDVQMAAFLGLFLVIGVLLTDQSLLMMIQAVVAAAIIIGGMWWYHSPHLGGATTGAVDEERRPPLTREQWRQAPRMLLRVAVLGLQAAPFALILFLFVPRPSFQLPLNTQTAIAGISDKLDPGRFAENALNETVAFRVEFPQGKMPFIDDLYWRGVVLWTTNGNSWARGFTETSSAAATWTTPRLPAPLTTALAPGFSEQLIEQNITLVGNPNTWLYALDSPQFQIERAQVRPGLIFDRTEPSGTVTYRAISDLQVRPADWSPQIQNRSLQKPTVLDPRIRELAGQLRAEVVTNDEIIDRAVAWFSTQGFVYTLKPGVMGDNATATFLFEQRKGFCGHYASALCVLMRAAGIPARVVLGYRGGEVNQFGGFLSVRQSHAHAWAEVWTGNATGGWRRVDLTSVIPAEDPVTGQISAVPAAVSGGAAARAAERAARPWPEQLLFKLRSSYEYVESRWDRWAVGYDNELQDKLLSWLGLDEFGGWAKTLGIILGLVLAAVMLGAGLWLWLRVRREWSLTADQRLYRAFIAAGARVGVVRQLSEGPRDYARRLAAACPEAATTIHAAGEAWLRLQYATSDSATDRAALMAGIRAVRRQRDTVTRRER